MQVLDKDMVKAVAEEHGVEVLDLEEAGLESMAQKKQSTDEADSAGSLVPRPPVVTVMGHVDHGKVSHMILPAGALLSASRKGGRRSSSMLSQIEPGDQEVKCRGMEAFDVSTWHRFAM